MIGINSLRDTLQSFEDKQAIFVLCVFYRNYNSICSLELGWLMPPPFRYSRPNPLFYYTFCCVLSQNSSPYRSRQQLLSENIGSLKYSSCSYLFHQNQLSKVSRITLIASIYSGYKGQRGLWTLLLFLDPLSEKPNQTKQDERVVFLSSNLPFFFIKV